MKAWLARHQKKVAMVLGILFISLTLLLYFWDNSKGMVVGDREIIKASDQHYNLHNSNIIEREKPSGLSALSSTLKKRQDQGDVLLIIMLLAGSAFLVYSLIPAKKGDKA